MINHNITEKFFSNIKFNEKTWCWDWIGSKNGDGYGHFKINGKHTNTHRISFMLLKGKIPEGLQIDHLCRNRACVNPDHLEAVTIKENLLRGFGAAAKNARKTHCKRGHEFNEENTILKSNGQKYCKPCKKMLDESYREKYPEKQKEYWKNSREKKKEKIWARDLLRAEGVIC